MSGKAVHDVLVGTWIGMMCRGFLILWLLSEPVMAGLPAGPEGQAAADPEAGRRFFNGKGLCYYCHGMDGYRDKLPQLGSDTNAVIAQLNPPPADLRNPRSLRLTTDKARAKAIREGHPGTGMLPDTKMTDQELSDTIAYLSMLRREGTLKAPSQ